MQNPIDSSISIEATNKLESTFLLNEMNHKFTKISRKFSNKNIYLLNIFINRLEWAINEVYSKGEKMSSDENLCFMFNFLKMLEKCFDVSKLFFLYYF